MVERHLVEGRAADAIPWAEQVGAGMVVLGSRGLGRLKRLLMGSVDEGGVHGSRFPVLVMRGGSEAWPPHRLVLADDDSEAARTVGELAAAIGGLLGIGATLVRAYPELPQVDEESRWSDARMADDNLRREQHLLEKWAQALEGKLGSGPETRIAVGDAAKLVVDAAHEAGDGHGERVLIVVGSRGLGLAGRLRLGSVSTRVLNAASGPVLVHPAVEKH